MWMTHKVRKDIPLDELAKQFKNTDIDVLLKHPKNKEAAAAWKAKKPVARGTVVYLLDPKVTVYIMKTPRGTEVMTEKEWKTRLAKLDKSMDDALGMYRRRLDALTGRHDAQIKVNREFPFVSFFCSNWYGDEGDEPVKQRKSAEAGLKKLETAVKARAYKQFEASCREAETKINAYSDGLYAWIEQLIGSGESWEKGLSFTRDASFVVFGACAMTVAAPATAAATAGWGALVGGGTSLMSSSAEEAGRAMAGYEMSLETSATKIGMAVLKGTAFGAAGASLARVISGSVASKMAEKMATSSVATKLSYQLLSRSRLIPKLSERVFEREIASAIKVAGEGTIYMPKAVMDKMATKVLSKLLIRGGVGGASKSIQLVLTKGKGSAWMEQFFKKNATRIGKMTEDQVAELMAADLIKDPLALEAFEAIVEDNVKVFEAELEKEARKEIERQVKKARKR